MSAHLSPIELGLIFVLASPPMIILYAYLIYKYAMRLFRWGWLMWDVLFEPPHDQVHRPCRCEVCMWRAGYHRKKRLKQMKKEEPVPRATVMTLDTLSSYKRYLHGEKLDNKNGYTVEKIRGRL